VDIVAWLRDLGLERYAQAFRDNDVDAKVLPHLTADDLKDIGVASVGHRRAILAAIERLGEAAEPATPATPPEVSTPTAPRPEAERRQLTVMFVDLVGSTALSGELDPEDMRQVILAYQQCCADVVRRWEGHIAKYMGDGILAYFGYPRAHEDDAERAVRAALALVTAVAGLAAGGRPLATRVGIATGRVVVGDLIGDEEARERAVVGDTPNLAARFQALAAPGQVLIGDATRRLLGLGFELQDLGRRVLHGVPEPVAVFAVLGERATPSRFEARSGPSLLPMVGRDQELALLRERWSLAKSGEGQGVLLVGEAGIGKSRITRALIDAVAREEHVRIRYQCSPYHSDSALWPVVQQLSHAAGLAAADAAEVRLDKLEALLGRAVAQVGESAALIADLMGLDGEARYGPIELTPQMRRMRTLEALNDQLLGLAAQRPVLVIAEDTHWIDPTTFEMIEQSLDRIADRRVLILLTSRPDRQPELAAHPHVTRLTLNRLGRAGVEAIVTRLGGAQTLPADVIDAIIARTDGVPLFVEELTKAILETGETSIPASLHDSLMARLDRIPEVKEVAQIAACIGREFDYALLAAVAAKPEAELVAALDKLAAAELVFRRGVPPEARYTFKHALVQDAAHQSLLRSRSRELHARIAEVLEARFPTIVESEPELLAHHYSHAHRLEPAIDYWERAGERAVQRSANIEAIDHLNRGLKLLEALPDTPQRARRELELQVTLGPALMAAKGHGATETGRSYARACALSEQLGDTSQHFRALWGSWRYHFVRSEHRTAHPLAEQCLRLAEQVDDVGMTLEACFALGGSAVWMADFASGRAHLERAVPLYDIEQHRSLSFSYGQDPGASNLSYLSWALWHLGYPSQAVERGRAALALAESLAHPHTLAQVSNYLALTHFFCRDWPAAARQADATIAVSREHGFPQTLGLATILKGRAGAEGEQIEASIVQIEEGIAAHEATGIGLGRPYKLAALAEAHLKANQIEEGLAVLADGLAYASDTGEGFYEPELHRLTGTLLLQSDRDDAATEAEGRFRRALDLARGQGARSLELRAATSLAGLWAEQGERRRAHDMLASALGWFSEGFEMPDLKDAAALLDQLA
jgi:class 3 adenylate cyclase/predicted ATPase